MSRNNVVTIDYVYPDLNLPIVYTLYRNLIV